MSNHFHVLSFVDVLPRARSGLDRCQAQRTPPASPLEALTWTCSSSRRQGKRCVFYSTLQLEMQRVHSSAVFVFHLMGPYRTCLQRNNLLQNLLGSVFVVTPPSRGGLRHPLSESIFFWGGGTSRSRDLCLLPHCRNCVQKQTANFSCYHGRTRHNSLYRNNDVRRFRTGGKPSTNDVVSLLEIGCAAPVFPPAAPGLNRSRRLPHTC